jgi:hypothetical protein
VTVIKREGLAKLLRQLADMVETGDSAEGRLEYTYDDADPSAVKVEAALRTGNLEGQGGMLLL